MSRSVIFLFVLPCVAALGSCKRDSASPKPDEPSPRTAQPVSATPTVRFAHRGDIDTPFPDARFAEAATQMLAEATPAKVCLRQAAITGELDETETDSTLRLTARLEPCAIEAPLNTSLLAVSGKRPPGETIAQGLRDMKKAVREILRLVHAPPGQVTAALASAEPDVQIAAAAIIAERRIVEAVDSLCTTLTDPREETADAAAEALKRTADPKAVSRIIGAVRKGDLRSQVRVIEILGHVGGDEAEAYLEMTAVGHPIPEVRELSKAALNEARKRRR